MPAKRIAGMARSYRYPQVSRAWHWAFPRAYRSL